MSADQRRLKVLFVAGWYPTPHDPVSGVFVRRHAEAIAERCDVRVIHVDPTFGRGAAPSLAAGAVPVVSAALHVPGRLGLLRRPYVEHLLTSRYAELVRSAYGLATAGWGRPDIIHGHVVFPSGVAAAPLAERCGVPLILTEHSSEYLPADGTLGQRSARVRTLMRDAVASAARVTVVSRVLRDAMLAEGFTGEYETVGNVVPRCDPDPVSENRSNVIVSVGLLVDDVKNVSGILRALSSLASHGGAFRLDVIGDGPDRGKLEGLAADLGLGQRVRFLGAVSPEEVRDHLKEASFLVLNSRFETFSAVTAEALMCGRPVVCSECGGPQEYVDDTCGMLVPVGDDEALANALGRMLDTYQSYDESAIRVRAESLFSAPIVAGRFLEIYEEVLAGR